MNAFCVDTNAYFSIDAALTMNNNVSHQFISGKVRNSSDSRQIYISPCLSVTS